MCQLQRRDDGDENRAGLGTGAVLSGATAAAILGKSPQIERRCRRLDGGSPDPRYLQPLDRYLQAAAVWKKHCRAR
jgi:hypothetical protein